MKNFLLLHLLLVLPDLMHAQEKPVTLTVDCAMQKGQLNAVWSWFGYDEPNYTYMKDGRKLLSELAELSHQPVYVRTHNLLTTGDGRAELKWGSTNAYTEDNHGRPIYNWTLVDSIIDAYIKRGMKPLMEIGFMPEALSTHPVPYKHNWSVTGELWTGWTYPPKDYTKWEELVFKWVEHAIDRYGSEEVKSWYWELWNEPNIKYWSGTFDEYCKLYDFTASAVKRACADCRIGGPHSTNPDNEQAQKFLRDFLQHCASGLNYKTGKTGSPLNFIAFHAKGNPALVEGHIRMNMSPQLKAVANGFKIVSSFEAFKKLPVIIGECDPEGCAACSMQKKPENGYRNGTLYSSYTAASYARLYELAEHYNINLVGAVTWAFEFEGQRWFDGFRDLATNGIDKPVLNVFRMFGMMPPDRILVTGDNILSVDEIIAKGVHGNTPDVFGIASRNAHSLAVLIWNYHDDDLLAPGSKISLRMKNIPVNRVLMHHYRIDSTHSNAYEAWKKIGAPQEVDSVQYEHLEESGQLQLLMSPQWMDIRSGNITVDFKLPRQGVSLLKLEW